MKIILASGSPRRRELLEQIGAKYEVRPSKADETIEGTIPEEIVKEYAIHFIIIAAIFMPQNAFLHAAYFTLRSGGKTVITFLFDSGFIWGVSIPCAFFLSRFTSFSIETVYAMCLGVEFLKCAVGFVLLKKGVWLHNIVDNV